MNTTLATAVALLGLLVPITASASTVLYPQFDLKTRSGDAGVSFTDTDSNGIADFFTIDATAIAVILAPAVSLDIPDESFTLTAIFPETGSGQTADLRSFGSGSFSVGTLLSGTFSSLTLQDAPVVSTTTPFGTVTIDPRVTLLLTDLVYTGGSLKGSLLGGDLLATYTTTGDPSLLAPHTGTFSDGKLGPFVPVPAAFWLFGSALAGIAGIARRAA